ncbi:MAG: YgjP-like metallopeptidase domain-containing protein [Cyanobacteriota bacterium]
MHLLVPNHKKVFKNFMYAYLPDWEEREQQLQSNYGKTITTNG